MVEIVGVRFGLLSGVDIEEGDLLWDYFIKHEILTLEIIELANRNVEGLTLLQTLGDDW